MLDDYLLGPIVIATALAVLLIQLRGPWKLRFGISLLMISVLVNVHLASLRADCYPTFFILRYRGWCSNRFPNPGMFFNCDSPSEMLSRGLALGSLVGLLWPVRRRREKEPDTF